MFVVTWNEVAQDMEVPMVLVRMVCQAKFGKANEVVTGFQQTSALVNRTIDPNVHFRILTDLSGPFDTVIQELEVESLAAWERLRTQVFSNPQVQALEAALPNVIESGRMEYYTIEAD
jgi:hypothetical protein